MTPNELRKIRQRLRWTQEKLANAVGVARNSVARWERGEMAISEPAARLIRMIAAQNKLKLEE
jgi:transcriptional regulator with XRE-family HTH domain